MSEKSTRRNLLKTIGAGLTLPLTAGVSAARSSTGEQEESEPYGVAWNEVTTFGNGKGATEKKGGQRHELIRTRSGYVAPGVVHHSRSAEDDKGLLEKYDTNGIRVFTEVLGREGYRLRGGSNLGGTYIGVGDADSDGWIVCVDTYGQTLWEHRVGQDSHRATLNEAAVVDETVVAAGRYEASEGDFWGWAVQYDRSGEQLWEKRFRPGDDSGPNGFNGVTATGDGEFLMAGRGRTGGRAGLSWSVRVTADGTERWNRLHPFEGEIGGGGNSGDREEANGVISVEDGGFLIVGLTRAAVANGWAALVLKLDSDGTIAWSRLLDTHRFLSADDATVIQSGEYLVTGNTGGVNPHFWTASLNPDGTLNWREDYLGTHTERATSIVAAPGGAMAGGHSPSRGQRDWPNPWLAHLDDDTTPSRDGFDPRVHGFGFGNWAGKTGVRKNGELFTLPYTETSGEDAVNWILGLDDPIARGEDLWDGGVELAEGLYRRQISTDGHCLGMVLSADHYFQSPDDLPRGVQFAQSVPHPTERYESVGERIRSEQDSFGHGRTATQVVLALNAPFYDPKPNHEKIRRSVANTGTAPIVLEMKAEESGSGNTKQGTGKIFHSGLVYHWEETEDAVELYYYDPDDPAENYKSPDEVYGTELEEEDSHLDRAFENPRYSLRIDPETGELLDDTHPGGRIVTAYAYFPVGRGAAVEDTFETQNSEGERRSEKQDALTDSRAGSTTTRAESDGVEVEYLDRTSTPESETPIESVEHPDIALPSLLESAVVATLDAPGRLRMQTPDGREVTSDNSEFVYEGATEYSEMVWAVGMTPGELRIDVEPEIGNDYTLRVMGNAARGGHISETIEGSTREDGTHTLDVALPEAGSGSITVQTPDTSTDADESSEVRAAEMTESAQRNTGANGPQFGREALAALGIMALVASGYLTLTGRV